MHIYKITNLVNGKIYIGQHTGDDLDKYLYWNTRDAKNNKNSKPALFSAINKYGPDSFTIESLVRIPDFGDLELSRSQLNTLEQFFIRTEDSRNRQIGYNICEGGEGVSSISWTEEMRQAARQRVAGKPGNRKGAKLSGEQRARISAATAGKKMPPMTWAHKIWESRRKNGTACPGYSSKRGTRLSQETKDKISASKKGKPIRKSKRTKPAWNKGLSWSGETKAKLSLAGKKRSKSPEYREKLRLAGIKGAEARWRGDSNA